MDFGTSVKTCMKKYVVFSGRATRSEFWWFTLFTFLVGLVASALDATVLGISPLQAGFGIGIATLASLVFFLPSLAVNIRRFHDVGKSGWWFLISMLMGGFLLFVVLMAIPFLLGSQIPGSVMLSSGNIMSLFFYGLFAIVITAIPYLYFMLKPSQPGPNMYGEAE